MPHHQWILIIMNTYYYEHSFMETHFNILQFQKLRHNICHKCVSLIGIASLIGSPVWRYSEHMVYDSHLLHGILLSYERHTISSH